MSYGGYRSIEESTSPEKPKQTRTKRLMKLLFRLGIFLLIGAVSSWAFIPFIVSGNGQEPVPISVNRYADLKPDPEIRVLKFMTLNIAHGRKSGPHQFRQSKESLQKNLALVADVLKRERPFAAALQEVDGPSAWSGKFEHLSWVADLAGYPYYFRGAHVSGLEHSYGTGMLAVSEPFEPQSVTFSPSLFKPPKGFVTSSFYPPWPGADALDIVSVHLDHLSGDTRMAQARELTSFFKIRAFPLVCMGDFNCGWDDEETLPFICKELGLKAWKPEDTEGTFIRSGRRLDWILISEKLEFVSYRILSDVVSDHYGVVAEILIE